MAVLNFIMGLLFLFTVVLQYNDPDAIWWMLIYGAAALCSILWFTASFRRIFPVIVMIIALVWMSFILPDVLELGSFNTHMFDSFTMHNIGIEEAREVGGLLIVSAWMIVLSFMPPKRLNAENTMERV